MAPVRAQSRADTPVGFSQGFSIGAALARLRLENLDSGILGREFPETAIRVSDRADHFELMSEKDVLRQVDELVAEVRACPARS